MRVLLCIVLLSCFFVNAADNPRVRNSDLDVLLGSEWDGALTYLDYQTSKKVTIPTTLSVTRSSDRKSTWVLEYRYPKEPGANSKDLLSLRPQGRMLNDEAVIERRVLPASGLKIVTEKRGNDNDKQASFRYTYLISQKSFSITKEVRYDDAGEYFERNRYTWRR